MVIREDTTTLFSQDKEYVLNYLRSRNFENNELNDIITNYPFGLLKEISIIVDGEEYVISHFLSKSDIAGYDIKKVNTILQTEDTNEIVFALVLGDDALVCDINTEAVYLWQVQTGNYQKIKVCDDLTTFLKNLNIKNEK